MEVNLNQNRDQDLKWDINNGYNFDSHSAIFSSGKNLHSVSIRFGHPASISDLFVVFLDIFSFIFDLINQPLDFQ